MTPDLPSAPQGYRWQLDMDLEQGYSGVTLIPNAEGRAFGYKPHGLWGAVHWPLRSASAEEAYKSACMSARILADSENRGRRRDFDRLSRSP